MNTTDKKKKPKTTIITLTDKEPMYLREICRFMLDNLPSDQEEYIPYRKVCQKVIKEIDAGGYCAEDLSQLMMAFGRME